MDFIICSASLIQLYFSFHFSQSSIEEYKMLQTDDKNVLQFVILQNILSVVSWVSIFVWTKHALQHANFFKFLQTLCIILMIAHFRFILSHFIVQFRPIKYFIQHGTFLASWLILFIVSFYKLKVQYWWFIAIIIASFIPFLRPYMTPFILVFFVLTFYPLKISISKKFAISALVLSIVLLPSQMIMQKRIRSLVYQHSDVSNPDQYLIFLYMINIVEECYLLESGHRKLTKRPMLTPVFVDFFQKKACLQKFNTDKDELLTDAYKQLLGDSVKTVKRLEYNKNTIGCCVLYNNNKADVVFRGTNSIAEWIGNIGGAAHTFSPTDKGYKHTQINQKIHKLMDAINSIVGESSSVAFMGHSRGATLAFYEMLQFCRVYPEKKVNGFFFAPPPFIDPKLKIPLNAVVESIFHKRDILYRAHEITPIGTSIVGFMKLLPVMPLNKFKITCDILQKESSQCYITKPKDFTYKSKYVVHDLYDYIMSLHPLQNNMK